MKRHQGRKKLLSCIITLQKGDDVIFGYRGDTYGDLFSGHHWYTDGSCEWRAEGGQWHTHSGPRSQTPLDTPHCLCSHVQALASGKKTLQCGRVFLLRSSDSKR